MGTAFAEKSVHWTDFLIPLRSDNDMRKKKEIERAQRIQSIATRSRVPDQRFRLGNCIYSGQTTAKTFAELLIFVFTLKAFDSA
jgi:hypothetical protein